MKKEIANRLLALVVALTMLVLAPVIALGEGEDTATQTDLQPVAMETAPTAEPTAENATDSMPETVPEEESAVEPASEPAEEEEPTDSRSETPAEPLPSIKARIKSNLDELDYVGVGTEMVLTLIVEGNGDYAYTVQWQMSTDMGEHWEDIPDGTEKELRIILEPEHNGVCWRAVVELVPHSAT